MLLSPLFQYSIVPSFQFGADKSIYTQEQQGG
jgi:hypothetical protein